MGLIHWWWEGSGVIAFVILYELGSIVKQIESVPLVKFATIAFPPHKVLRKDLTAIFALLFTHESLNLVGPPFLCIAVDYNSLWVVWSGSVIRVCFSRSGL
jgi:hypothetical protein